MVRCLLCAVHTKASCQLADMRKAMPRDVHKKSIIPLKRPVRAEDLDE